MITIKKINNIVSTTIVCAVVISELIQACQYKKQGQELNVLQENITSLQKSITNKDFELKNVISEKEAAEVQLKNEQVIMTEEINQLKATATDLKKYRKSTEQTLSNISKELINSKAEQAINSLKNKDFATLVTLLNPSTGLRLSSSPEIKQSIDKQITQEQLLKLTDDNKKYKWGVINGEGEQLQLTFNQYYDMFLYDKDYAKQSEINYNKYINRSDKKSNIFDIYKKGIVVEYFFKGTKEKDFMDWVSLYLCFEKIEDNWFLTGIVHS